MKTYYKATKLDGTDFYSGTVDYAGALASGRSVKRKPKTEFGFECCSSTVYHAADTPSETLVGCSWPCRLFEVTGRPVAQEGHKYGFRSLRVVQEIPAWQALGPNGQEVAALIEEIESWSQAHRDAARDAAKYAAWYAAYRAAEFAAWDAAESAARGAALGGAEDAVRDAAGLAGLAAGRAATALVTKDLITPEQFDVLFAPVKAAREVAA
jgi:hypothetical protein